MREIKFRGQDKANQKWLYGNLEIPLLNQSASKCYIIGYSYGQYQKHEVELSTIGQYTNLKDEDNVEIFEGDIVEAWSQGVKAIGEVKQRIDGLWIMYPSWQKGIAWNLAPDQYNGATTVKVIGNKFQNQEWL